MRPESNAVALERQIVGIAERQHGVLAHQQLLCLGLGPRGIGHRVERGRMHRAFQTLGWRVVRLTHRQLTREPELVLADLRALLRPTPRL